MRNNKHSIAWSAALVTVLGLVLLAQPAHAQTFKIIYNFTGGVDGANPSAGVTSDRAGNLYGATFYGGYRGGNCMTLYGCGTVFKLAHSVAGWILTPLYAFKGGDDGDRPLARVIIGPDGNLYGTTAYGGRGCGGDGCGTVFNLKPPAHTLARVFGDWTETVLYRFTGGSDGSSPEYADLIFDQAGAIYGTARSGGSYGDGAVYQLRQTNSGWTESVLFSFTPAGGAFPSAGVIFDEVGNLYGTTGYRGFFGYGTVYELRPSEAGWVEDLIYAFQGQSDGEFPMSSLVFDESGNLYGTTATGGSAGGGTVFELITLPNGNWTFAVIYGFIGSGYLPGPIGSLAIDSAGSLYGMTYADGAYQCQYGGCGNVFKLTPSEAGWIYSSLHDFTGGSDGANPFGTVTLDASGNLYGTASSGGAYGYGVVWEIMP